MSSLENNKARLRDHVRIMRLDHATKHVFMVPGVIAACFLAGMSGFHWVNALYGIIACVTIASANYTINEYLDREFDKFHPEKSARSAVQTEFSPALIWVQWALLVVVGLGAAYLAGVVMFGAAIVFALQGIVYNVRPLRSKERAFLDVVSESINNPLRLIIGWAIVSPDTLPPLLLLTAYWLGGAFLMAAKRLSEYREICGSKGKDLLVKYRRSFAFYTEGSLAGSCLAYALLSYVFIGIFLVEWRVEYVIALPFLAALFVAYYLMSAQPGSVAQKPEKLFKEPALMMICALLVLTFCVASYVNIPLASAFLSIHPLSL